MMFAARKTTQFKLNNHTFNLGGSLDYELYRRVATFFKNSNLAERPLVIRRIKLKASLDGQCEIKDGVFLIKINRNLSENYSIDVVIHEVAHAVAWDKDCDVHGPNWGRAYSKVYRLFLENFIES